MSSAPLPVVRRPAPAVPGLALSIVIPAYNEAERLPVYLPRVLRFVDGLGASAEIIVVDDGSTDGTAAYVESIAASDARVRLVRQPRNRGKGAAVRRGVFESRGARVLFTDADGATPIQSLRTLTRALDAGADLAIGSRRVAGSEAKRGAGRSLLGLAFAGLVRWLAVPGVRDTQCGFKLLPRAVALRLFGAGSEDGFAFDVELLYLARRLGLSIAECPVRWRAVEGSKVRPLRDAWRMFVAVLRIRRRGVEPLRRALAPARLQRALGR